ncbi:MAG: transaldolase [Dehalococcoidia bacterium]
MSNPLHELNARGQSIWYDNLNRELIRTGALRRMVDEDAVTGGTSNPSIFEKAVGSSDAYDDDIRALASAGKSTEEVFDALTIKDIQLCCDLFSSVYERTDAADGYCSLEVSPEIAYDGEVSARDAKRLFAALSRPNAMIKIPGTQQGLQAVENCLTAGLNINITLLFGVENYEQVALAYIRALERRVQAGESIDRIASVASFFISRVDTLIDQRLDAAGRMDLAGNAGVANAKIAYAKFKEIFSGERWEALALKGARVQRPLWASTSTKNPSYRDVIYVEELIGPHTINTMPQVTLDAFRDHGVVRDSIEENVNDAFAHVEALRNAGVELREVTDELQTQGVDLFADSFHKAFETVRVKCDAMRTSAVGSERAGGG